MPGQGTGGGTPADATVATTSRITATGAACIARLCGARAARRSAIHRRRITVPYNGSIRRRE